MPDTSSPPDITQKLSTISDVDEMRGFVWGLRKFREGITQEQWGAIARRKAEIELSAAQNELKRGKTNGKSRQAAQCGST